MKAATFSALLLEGHKGPALELPFDPAERWGPAVSLRAGRRGHFVQGLLNGKPFESVVVARARKFFVLVSSKLQEQQSLKPGQRVKVSLEPSSPSAETSTRAAVHPEAKTKARASARSTAGKASSTAPPAPTWKKGRGRLGVLDPLLGTWEANAESPYGPTRCVRTFSRALGKSYVTLNARWEVFGKIYEELAVYGAGEDGTLSFWSFTSDGKRSQGRLSDVTDLHPQAVGFEAQMPAGLARTAYWPADDGGVMWVTEAKTKKGWSRFVTHHCHAR
ncbi:MAG: DUF1905 domain-containing protein [Thermoanaerobaculia bacterium]